MFVLYTMKRRIYQTRLYLENRRKRAKYTLIKGDETEQFVADIMRKFKDIEDVQVIGNTGSIFDIVYKYVNDDYRALQVKTLSYDHYGNDMWKTTFNPEQYPPDTLIVLVNEERTRFGLISYGKINVKTLSLGFKNMNRGKYRRNKYTDIVKFSDSFNRRSKCSTLFDVDKSFSELIKKEYDSIQRLNDKCNEHKISFNRNSTNGNVIDCFINNKTAQCKYSSSVKFNLYKSNGSIDGVHQIQSYNESDPLDYFIFEINGYHGQFCIVPKKIMVERGYLSTKKINGKKSISLCTPDYIGEHWCVKYWNNFNL